MDKKVADNSAVLNAYMYLDVQSERFINKDGTPMNLNDIMRKIERTDDNKAYYDVLSNAIKNDPSIGKMELIGQSHYENYNLSDNDQPVLGSGNKYTGNHSCQNDYIQGCAFRNPNTKEIYVVYRGTGDGRWPDDGKGFELDKTPMQDAAKTYFDTVIENHNIEGNVYVTGHSKGGNEAQYVTMMSEYNDKITGCYSIDGQGFSTEAVKMFKKNNSNYDEILSRMYSINGANDPIHNLPGGEGIIIPDKNTYYVSNSYFNGLGDVHDIAALILDSGLIWGAEEGFGSKLGKELSKYLSELPDEGQKQECIMGVMILAEMFVGGKDGYMFGIDDGFEFDDINDICGLLAHGGPVIIKSILSAIKDEYGTFAAIGAGIAFVSLFIIAVNIIAITPILGPVLLVGVTIIEFVKLVHNITESVEKILCEITQLVSGAKVWLDNAFSYIKSQLKKLEDWLFKNSSGYKYASTNTNIQIDTNKMKNYAGQLSALSDCSKSLDSRMNSLYFHAGFDWNTARQVATLGSLLKAGIVLDFAGRLDKCVTYLNETAEEFENVEKEIAGMC